MRDRDFEFMMGKNGHVAEVLSPNQHAAAAVSDAAAAIDYSSFNSPISYLVCPIAIYYETDGTDAVAAASHYLPADVIIPIKLHDITALSVIAAVSGETDTATLSELV